MYQQDEREVVSERVAPALVEGIATLEEGGDVPQREGEDCRASAIRAPRTTTPPPVAEVSHPLSLFHVMS